MEVGKLKVPKGTDKGIYDINDLGVGEGGLAGDFGAESVDLYSSANHVLKEHFYGAQWDQWD